jgi:8-oxo-dGTP pyrophosphatase MutT (NUDIX family)
MSTYLAYDQPPVDFHPTGFAAGCFIEWNGSYLYLKRHPNKIYGNTWGIPAGKLELGEDPKTAALREVQEEVGISLAPEQLVPMGCVYMRLLDRPKQVMPCSCDAQGREIQAGRRAHSPACSLSEKAGDGDRGPPQAGTPASPVEDYPYMDYEFHMFYQKLHQKPELVLAQAEHLEARWVTPDQVVQLPLIIGGPEALSYFLLRLNGPEPK